ncbi:hypothetical protein KI387_017545, partial [Taxus chinensis]
SQLILSCLGEEFTLPEGSNHAQKTKGPGKPAVEKVDHSEYGYKNGYESGRSV